MIYNVTLTNSIFQNSLNSIFPFKLKTTYTKVTFQLFLKYIIGSLHYFLCSTKDYKLNPWYPCLSISCKLAKRGVSQNKQSMFTNREGVTIQIYEDIYKKWNYKDHEVENEIYFELYIGTWYVQMLQLVNSLYFCFF